MNKREKCKFVKDLMESVRKKLTADILAGKTPEGWDGHELRRLLADTFVHEVCHSVMTGKRLKAYRNAVIVNDL